jgi:hypothetical protein
MTMRPRVQIVAIASCVALILSCGDAGPTPPTPSKASDPPPPPPAPTATLVIELADLSPDVVVVAQDDTAQLNATLVMSDGRRLGTTARWTSSDTQVVAMRRFGGALGLAPGKAIITATIDSPPLQAQVPAVVLAKGAETASGALVVQRFSMMEFQYPSAPNSWFYAPQIQATTAPGRRVFISYVIFSIPGLDDPIPGWACDASLSAGTVVELNGEVYGDWTMSLFGDRQATGADATARITYTDDSGVSSTLTLHGPIVHGSLPTTYSGGGGGMGGACYHGYGSG